MKSFHQMKPFKKDVKLLNKRGYNLSLLVQALSIIGDGLTLPAIYWDHQLQGNWKGWRECHIQPDWLLIYQTTDDEVRLARTGTHADLFGT